MMNKKDFEDSLLGYSQTLKVETLFIKKDDCESSFVQQKSISK